MIDYNSIVKSLEVLKERSEFLELHRFDWTISKNKVTVTIVSQDGKIEEDYTSILEEDEPPFEKWCMYNVLTMLLQELELRKKRCDYVEECSYYS